jgi:FkbM family methyltransferase
MTGSQAFWRPYSGRAALARKFLPSIDRTLDLGNDLRLRANLRTHLGLFRQRTREREIRTARAIAGASPGPVIYDVGANIGLYSVIFAADPGRAVVSFEPSHLVLPYLRANIELNRLVNVHIEPIALSESAGRVPFTLDNVTTCTSHVSSRGEPGVEVACSDLDSLVEGGRWPAPDLIKLDVEGHDEPILRGMTRLLARRRPYVCLEGGLRSASGDIPSLRLLREAGYVLCDLGRRHTLEPDTGEYVVLAVPRHDAAIPA